MTHAALGYMQVASTVEGMLQLSSQSLTALQHQVKLCGQMNGLHIADTRDNTGTRVPYTDLVWRANPIHV